MAELMKDKGLLKKAGLICWRICIIMCVLLGLDMALTRSGLFLIIIPLLPCLGLLTSFLLHIAGGPARQFKYSVILTVITGLFFAYVIYGQTDIDYCILNGNAKILKMLVHKYDVNAKNKRVRMHCYDTRLISAFRYRLSPRASDRFRKQDEKIVKVLEVLVDNGAEVNTLDSCGKAALHYAAEKGYVKCVTFLIAAGADINIRSAKGDTPLHAYPLSNQTNIFD